MKFTAMLVVFDVGGVNYRAVFSQSGRGGGVVVEGETPRIILMNATNAEVLGHLAGLGTDVSGLRPLVT